MDSVDERTEPVRPDAEPPATDVATVINIDAMERRRDEYVASYRGAAPFDHVVIDDVLPADVLARVYAELAQMDSADWNSYVHFNERKYSNTDMASWGPTLRAVSDAFASERFISFIESLSGFAGLHADASLDGGGVHRSYRGGFLNVHADFTAHHTIKNWRRRVNLLLYLNPVWETEWGGALELWNRDMTAYEAKVEPVGNRMLLFTTDEHSYHGHPDPLRSPEGLARESLALYYFTEEARPVAKSTDYRSRPDDGAGRVLIFLDKKVLAAYDVVKRRFHVSDTAVRRVMGTFSRRPK